MVRATSHKRGPCTDFVSQLRVQLVNKIVGADVARVESGYGPGTSDLAIYYKNMPMDGTDQRLALVDTPGSLDPGVARDISEFLAEL
jgi:hypothetical protein